MKFLKKLILPITVLCVSLFLCTKANAWETQQQLQQEIVKKCESFDFSSCRNVDVFYIKYLESILDLTRDGIFDKSRQDELVNLGSTFYNLTGLVKIGNLSFDFDGFFLFVRSNFDNYFKNKISISSYNYICKTNSVVDNFINKFNLPTEFKYDIVKIVNSPSAFEGVNGMIRKPLETRILDMLEFYNNYQCINKYYNQYGLDIVGFRNLYTFLDERTYFVDIKKVHHDNLNPKKFDPLYNNKKIFYEIMSKNNKDKLPELNIFINSGVDSESSFKEAMSSLNIGEYILKLTGSARGYGIYLIKKFSDNDIRFYDGKNNEVNEEEFLCAMKVSKFIIQNRVKQHKRLEKLNSSSLNTIRIITTRYNKEAHVLTAELRMGVGNSVIDNGAAGGTYVGINLEDGTLKKFGCYSPETDQNFFGSEIFTESQKQVELKHPDSGVEYNGYKLPYWPEVVGMVKKLHEKEFTGLSSIGWDVAITPEGPIVMELNYPYGINGSQAASGGFREKWEKLKYM